MMNAKSTVPKTKNMKTNFINTAAMAFTASLLLVFTSAVQANGGKDSAGKKTGTENQPVQNYTIQFDNSANKIKTVDSALIILDKYDHTGAGVVINIFYTDSTDQLVLTGIPEGKYYAEIITFGVKRQHFSKVITVTGAPAKKKKSKKNAVPNTTTIRLDYMDTYMVGNAVIPPEDVRQFAYRKN